MPVQLAHRSLRSHSSPSDSPRSPRSVRSLLQNSAIKRRLAFQNRDLFADEHELHDRELRGYVSSQRLTEIYHRAFNSKPAWISIPYDNEAAFAVNDVVTLIDNDLLHIKELYRDAEHDDALVVRGVRLRHARSLLPSGSFADSEVIILQQVYPDSKMSRGLFLETVELGQIVPFSTQHIKYTNQPCVRSNVSAALFRPMRAPTGSLVCRWKKTVWYSEPKGSDRHTMIELLRPDESDRDCRVDIKDLHKRVYEQRKSINAHHRPGTYTMIDACCGAGFASQGAKQAGIEVLMAFDKDGKAILTYQKNHCRGANRAQCTAITCDFFDFIEFSKGGFMPDILHISFPCQFFSPAHTIEGRDDEVNSAIILSLGEFLRVFKPRLLTIEETLGCLFPRHKPWFDALQAQFLENGYSVRWAKVDLAEFGECSRRVRLIMIGAAPGEELPFPQSTHNRSFDAAQDPNLLPAVSVYDRIQHARRDHPDQDLRAVQRSHGRVPWPAYDPRRTKVNTLTCSRTWTMRHNVHYSGQRFWTSLEIALIQGAPATWTFSSRCGRGDKWRQAGNAFPVNAAEALFRSCKESLIRTDRKYGYLPLGEEATPTFAGNMAGTVNDAIVID